MIQFRDFLYLDAARLRSFVSQIPGGLTSEASEKILQGGGLDAGLNLGFGTVDASKVKNKEFQRSIQMTDSTYFDTLYDYLIENQQIMNLTSSDAQERDTLCVGNFIEVQGSASPPVLENWVRRLESTFDFFEQHVNTIVSTQKKRSTQGKGRAAPTISSQQIKEHKKVLHLLIDFINLSRSSEKPYICTRTGTPQYTVWCGILPQFEVVPLQETLPAEVHILGRVERLLNQQDIWKMVDLTQFEQSEQAIKLVELLSGLSGFVGKGAISEVDLQAQYPDVFIVPVAIYQ